MEFIIAAPKEKVEIEFQKLKLNTNTNTKLTEGKKINLCVVILWEKF